MDDQAKLICWLIGMIIVAMVCWTIGATLIHLSDNNVKAQEITCPTK